jgi:hypothetical protein
VYLQWFKDIFENGKRTPPPFGDITIVVVPKVMKIDKLGAFILDVLVDFQHNIIDYYADGKTVIGLTDGHGMWINNILNPDIAPYSVFKKLEKSNTIITAIVKDNKLSLYNASKRKFIDNIDIVCKKVLTYKNQIYIINEFNVSELSFIENDNGDIIVGINPVSNISQNATQVFDGVVIQNLLDSYYISIFPKSKTHYQFKVDELVGYRIIDAKYEKNILVVIGEKSGKYDEFIFKIYEDCKYIVRKNSDVANMHVNFTVLDNGICAREYEDGLELFFNSIDKQDVKLIKDDSLVGYKLITNGANVLCIMDNKIMKVIMR